MFNGALQINKVELAGRLAKDPCVKHTPNGFAFCALRLAITTQRRLRDDRLIEETLFVDVETAGRQAEACREHLKKGSPVLIEGRLVREDWENDLGQKWNKLFVRADKVNFLEKILTASSAS